MGFSYRPASHVAWHAGTTTLRREIDFIPQSGIYEFGYRTASLWNLEGRYDNLMPELTLSPHKFGYKIIGAQPGGDGAKEVNSCYTRTVISSSKM